MQYPDLTNQQMFSSFSAQDRDKIEHALAIIAQIPETTPYQRPKGIDVAIILMEFKVDVETILAAILSDPRLEDLKPKPDITKQFGKTVAALVKDINWLNKLNVYSTVMSAQSNQPKRYGGCCCQ